ncbi:copine family protein [Nitzschia inconspicua]|uniref:Copine family protein n=1 Tax=Nitzschia inconspicua TaxID=303405 RepID=A0A9K3KWU9_9STRA|nr:copine family protein [Nitzschia inconspicua]
MRNIDENGDVRNSGNKSKVNIKLYASRLKNVAGAFKGTSDPYAVVTLLAGGPNEIPRVLGKTEVIKNSLSPDWITQFTVDYEFGKETRINIGIFDEVRKTGKHKPMGSAQFELGEILGSRGNVKAKSLKTGGTLFCRVTKTADEDYGILQLQLRGEDLKVSEGGGLFGRGKPDPFFILNAQSAHAGGNRVWHQEYRSEVSRENDRPQWNRLEISMERICGGDRDRAIQIEVYSWEKNGNHKRVGKFETSVNGMLTAANVSDRGLELVSKGKSSGKIFVLQAYVIGGSALPPSMPLGITASAPPISITPSDPSTGTSSELSASLPATSTSSENSLPEPLPPPMLPSVSSYPITISDSASSLPPAIPPPAFDLSEGPKFGPSGDLSEDMGRLDISSRKPSAPYGSPPRRKKKAEFVDYISGGLEMNLSIAIDFTGSNGDPRIPGTLHHINRSGELNDYEKAITAVGSVIARYDSDQRFPVLGFGAKYDGSIRHCFQVGSSSELAGLKGVLEGYRSVFSTGLTMSGPTVFAEVIQHAAIQAQREFERKQSLGKQSYSILLILTDGAVTDEQQTTVALKYASSAPLSIVIVGVGNDNFSKMKFLDTVHKEDSDMRDIVKFVEFNRFRNDRAGLTLETLSEIPSQVVQFFHEKGIQPLPPVSGSMTDVFADAYNSADDIELDFDFGEDGSIRLANSKQATWNATQYGDAALFMTNSPTTFSGNSSVYGVSSTSPYNVSTNVSLSPGREKPKLSPYVGTASTNSSNRSSEEIVVQVKVPANVQPGSQLRIRNPMNGNEKVVVVPMGVPPGGTFSALV